jgi:hypothetical protein
MAGVLCAYASGISVLPAVKVAKVLLRWLSKGAAWVFRRSSLSLAKAFASFVCVKSYNPVYWANNPLCSR